MLDHVVSNEAGVSIRVERGRVKCIVEILVCYFEEFADDAIALNLLKMLQQLPMKTWTPGKSVRIETHLQFPQEWGLGSSSTLCALLARWSLGDAQKIQQAVWGGSGYDVAVAEVGKPLVYWISGDEPNWAEWRLMPELSANWWILMPGNKQNSRESLRSVKERLLELQQEPFIMHQLKQIIDRIKLAEDVPTMEAGLEMYQAILGTILELDTPYQKMGWQPVRGCSPLCWDISINSAAFLINKNAASATNSGAPAKVITVLLVDAPGSTSKSITPFTVSTTPAMALILAISLPSDILGIHSIILMLSFCFANIY